MGIDIGPAGATPNDAGDTDGFLNFPVITSATISGGLLTLNGLSPPGRGIEFYRASPDPVQVEGKAYLITLTEGSTDDLDPAAGNSRFEIPVPAGAANGSLLTALAIGSVSEFAAAATIGNFQTDLGAIITLGANVTIVQGEQFEHEGTFLDADSSDWTLTVDYGDGSGEQAIAYSIGNPTESETDDGPSGYDRVYSFQLEHDYRESGEYTVVVRAIDNGLNVAAARYSRSRCRTSCRKPSTTRSTSCRVS